MQEIKKVDTLSFIEKNSFFILIVGIMTGGVLIGSIAFCGMSSPTNNLSFIANGFIEKRSNTDFANLLLNTFLSSTGQLFIMFILGFWAVAQPIELFLPLLKGLGLGASLAQIYASTGSKGFLIILLLIIPYTLVFVFAIVIAIREAFKLSNIFAKKAFYDTNTDGMKKITKLYCQKFCILEIIIVIASLIDCLCTFLFSRFLL